MYQLKNDKLEIEVHPTGAELFSIKRVATNRECLWQGDEAYWGRRAPVLFPFVGKLKNNSYHYQGIEYPMNQHGFARDMVFQLHEQSEHHLHLYTLSTPETLAVYPFHFRLDIQYTLHEQRISCNWGVRNTGKEKMYFSIGAHPGFICPPNDNEYLSDYLLEFNADESSPRNLLSSGLYNGETEPVFHDSRTILLNDDLFLKDAIVLKNLSSSSVELKHKSGTTFIKMDFKGFPYLGIWKKPGARFLCIEPWYGLADNDSHNGDLELKEGVLPLQPEDVFYASYHIHLLDT